MILQVERQDFDQGEVQKGPRAGEPYTRYDVWFTGRKDKASIFANDKNEAVVDYLTNLQPGQKADFTLEAKPSGKYTNYTILDVRPVNGAAQTDAPLQQATPGNLAEYQESIPYQADGSKVSQEVWEAKDRATYMESAYKSASQVFQGQGETKEERHNLIVLARWIYAEIMLAHDDKPLPTVRE